jgi:hypothetical protein
MNQGLIAAIDEKKNNIDVEAAYTNLSARLKKTKMRNARPH